MTQVENNPIRVWRNEYEIQGHELALAVGCSERSIYAYETGAFKPSKHRIKQLASLMGIEPHELNLRLELWRHKIRTGQ